MPAIRIMVWLLLLGVVFSSGTAAVKADWDSPQICQNFCSCCDKSPDCQGTSICATFSGCCHSCHCGGLLAKTGEARATLRARFVFDAGASCLSRREAPPSPPPRGLSS